MRKWIYIIIIVAIILCVMYRTRCAKLIHLHLPNLALNLIPQRSIKFLLLRKFTRSHHERTHIARLFFN